MMWIHIPSNPLVVVDASSYYVKLGCDVINLEFLDAQEVLCMQGNSSMAYPHKKTINFNQSWLPQLQLEGISRRVCTGKLC